MYGQWRKPNVEPTVFGQAMQQNELYEPKTSAVVGAYVKESTVGVGTLAADSAAADVTRLDRTGTKITEDEYKNNPELYSEGVKWYEGMTSESAAVSKEFNDGVQKRAQLIQDASGGQATLGFIAGFGAGVFEPKNITTGLATAATLGPLAELGVLGGALKRAVQMRKQAIKTASEIAEPIARKEALGAARKSSLGFNVKMGAAEGVIGGVAVEPSNRYSAKILQQDYTMMDSLFNVATSAAFGSLVPVAVRGVTAPAPFIKEKMAKFKGRTMDVVAEEVDLATAQFAAGQRVDVSPVEAAEIGIVARKSVAEQVTAVRNAVKAERGIDILPPEEAVTLPPDLTVQTEAVSTPYVAEWQEGLSPRTIQDLQEPTSWAVREKDTGKTVMETSSADAVQKLNTDKYEAVPIVEHLANLNGQTYSKAADATLKAERVRDAALGGENLEAISSRIDETNAAAFAKSQADAVDPRNDTLIDYDAMDAADERRAIAGVENDVEAEAYYQEAEAEIRQMLADDILNEEDIKEYRKALDALENRKPIDALETLKLCFTRG